MPNLTYTNIFDAIIDDKAEAADLQFRADLMLVIRDIVEARKLKPVGIAEALGIKQPRVSELMNGKVDKFSSDKLIGFLSKLGFRFKPIYVATKGSKSPVQCQVSKEAA